VFVPGKPFQPYSVTRLGKNLIFGYFFKQFQNMVRCGYFSIQKELGVDVLDFQFDLLYFGYSFGYISKYWAKFCFIFGSLCSQIHFTGRLRPYSQLLD
jgi:hypothetical protein